MPTPWSPIRTTCKGQPVLPFWSPAVPCACRETGQQGAPSSCGRDGEAQELGRRKGKGDVTGTGFTPRPGESECVNWPGLEVTPRMANDTQHAGLRSHFTQKSLLREFFPLRDNWQYCNLTTVGCYWYLVSRDVKHPTTHGPAPTTKNCLVQSVNGAEVEKP